VSCALSPIEYQQFIVRSLTVADSCALPILEPQIGLLWDLSGGFGCDRELQYLYTRLQALKIVMACSAKDVDSRYQNAEDHTRTTAESREDGWSQAQATAQNFRVSDACSTARYDDVAKGQMRSGSTRTARSSAVDDAYSAYRDEGKGKSRSYQTLHTIGQTNASTESETFQTGVTTGRGSRKGCKYDFSQSADSGSSNAVNITVGAGVGAVAGVSENSSIWDMEMYQSAASNQTATNTGCGTRNIFNDHRQRTRRTRDACGFFDAMVDATSNSKTVADATDVFTSFRDQFAHADGAGESKAKAQARSENSAQGTSKAHNDAESHRRMTQQGFSQTDDIKAHQRFEHLKKLYDNTWENIQYKKKLLASRIGATVGNLLTCQPDGFCSLANAVGVLIQNPATHGVSCRAC